MATATYLARRGELEQYFDRTAVDAWARLTSDAPVSGVRATVRAGRDRMRATLLRFLPADLQGLRVLDAGCGTGALAVEAARRGAAVTAIDLSPTLIALARERAPAIIGGGSVAFAVGDMTETAAQGFDYVVAMDSLIHYRPDDMAHTVSKLAANTRQGVLFTFAPRTAMLSVMHAVGRLFPRGDRAPAIVPVGRLHIAARIMADPAMVGWRVGQDAGISSGFYKSHALELRRR